MHSPGLVGEARTAVARATTARNFILNLILSETIDKKISGTIVSFYWLCLDDEWTGADEGVENAWDDGTKGLYIGRR